MDKREIESLRSRLAVYPAGCHLLYEETCGSTNDLAVERWKALCEAPCLFLTGHQTHGKGRFDRVWESKKGASLTFSLLICPKCRTESVPMLTEVFALAVCDALQKTCGRPFGIKWPNDVVYDSRKVCGILTVMTTDLKAAVIGAGINLGKEAYPPELAEKAVSLEEVCPIVPKTEDLLFCVIDSFFEKYSVFSRTEDMSGLKNEYESLLVNTGRQVRLTDSEGILTGVAKGIDEKGRLIFQTDDGQTVLADSGEVSVRGLYGVH